MSRLWKQETAKALENFGSGGLPRQLIRAYGEVKQAALGAAQRYKPELWPEETALAISAACTAVIRGDHDEDFPLSLSQGGAGTSIHLNINEVISSIVERSNGYCLDPLEDLARFQSTNDTFATAVNIALLRGLRELEKLVIHLQEKLVLLETEYDSVLMTGRTEMQDALPFGLGQLFGSWAGMIERDRWRLSKLAERIREVPLGGTAIGTCFNAPRNYMNDALQSLRSLTGLPLARSQNLPDAVAHKDSLAELASGYALAAGNLLKITGDLLYYSSSPVAEFRHPELQWGSSIMPVKVNPVLLEFVQGLALRVDGEGRTAGIYARESRLQLNAMLPFLAESLFRQEEDLSAALKALCRFFDEVDIDTVRMEANLAASPALLNALLPKLGYHRLKPLINEFSARPPRDLEEFRNRAAEVLSLNPALLDRWLSPEELIGQSF
jgi:aspartate ammonia-lyase